MAIYEDWRIFRRILNRDLALDNVWSAAYGVIWSATWVARLTAGTKLILCWSKIGVVGAWRCQSTYEDV